MEIWIYVAAVYNAGFGLFHLTFWKAFDWKKDLRRVSAINRGVMQVLNICLTLVFFFGATVYAVAGPNLMQEFTGKALLLFFALFWSIRTILQPIYFGNDRISLIFSLIFLLGAAIHGWVAFHALF